MKSKPLTIVMVAGEASGDVLGADLLAGLQERFDAITAKGVGGPRMQAHGFNSLADFRELSIIGIVEAVQRLPSVWRIFRALIALLKAEQPALLITIDLPDFNLMLAARARKLGIPVVHYVSPQVWAWRPNRIHTIAKRVDHLLALFPFEAECYRETSLPVTFVGHPMVHHVRSSKPQESIREELNVDPTTGKLLVMLPGSRRSELQMLLPTMARTFAEVHKLHAEVVCAVALAETLSEELFWSLWPDDVPRNLVLIRQGITYDLVAAADAALVASGTATLETALLDTPMVVAYRVKRTSYELGRRLIRVPYVSLVNLILNRHLVKERLQNEMRVETLQHDLESLLFDEMASQRVKEGYQEVRRLLTTSDRSPVDVITDFIHHPKKG
ncbi:MAG: lipid-A-disaccharide synthase [Magnetococcales bacterium]|nr:lipid-A-disaccharide synthase [Magnetococcales bacterium]